MAYLCLPTETVARLLKGLKSGEIDAEKFANMSVEERKNFLTKFVGDDAKNVSDLFNSKSKDFEKLNTKTTEEQDIKITELSNKVKSLEGEDMSSKEKRIEYGRKVIDLTEYTNSLKPKGKLFSLTNILSLPKSALTSVLHFSAPLVQGWGMISTKNFWQGIPKMMEYFAKPDSYKNLNADIISHPNYELAKDGKLGLTSLGDKLNMREEALQSSILEHIPKLGKVIKASSRAFTGFLNYVRFSRFNDLIEAAKLRGEDVTLGSRNVRDIAKVVNDFTGRGALGKGDKYANTQAALNSTFFSPRKISATIEMFDPVNYLDPKISKTARLAATRQLVGSILVTSAVYTLANMMGAQVDTDPTSTNFGKVKIGKTTFDMTGGNAVYVRLLARIAEQKEITSSGKTVQLGEGYKPETAGHLVEQFFINKLSPTAAIFADYAFSTVDSKGKPRKDPYGNDLTVGGEVYNKFVPIVMQNFIDLANSNPEDAAVWLPSLSSIFGVEMQTGK